MGGFELHQRDPACFAARLRRVLYVDGESRQAKCNGGLPLVGGLESFEQGAGSPGQAFVSLPEEIRYAVHEEMRHELGDTGGPIEIEVEYRFGSGRR